MRHLVNQNALFDVVEIMKIHEFNRDVIEVAFLVIFGLTLPGKCLIVTTGSWVLVLIGNRSSSGCHYESLCSG